MKGDAEVKPDQTCPSDINKFEKSFLRTVHYRETIHRN